MPSSSRSRTPLLIASRCSAHSTAALLRIRFGQMPRDHVVILDFEVGSEEGSWVVDVVSSEQAVGRRPSSCDAPVEKMVVSDTASSAFGRFYSTMVNEQKHYFSFTASCVIQLFLLFFACFR
jgi:hypothetical protein